MVVEDRDEYETNLMIESSKRMNKYFVPDIEDIRIGYSYEVFYEPDNTWYPVRVQGMDLLEFNEESTWWEREILNRIKNSTIRVPFISKTILENEEWNTVQWLDFSTEKEKFDMFTEKECIFLQMRKGKWELRWWGDPEYIEIYESYQVGVFFPEDERKKTEYDCIYQGSCFSVNELKYIQKLLRIKI